MPHTQEQNALESIVRSHIGWVYASARRRVRDQPMAEDVTQAVFLLWWRKGRHTAATGETRITGWLYRAVQYCAANAMRLKRIHEKHEREAAMQKTEQVSAPEAPWADVAEILEAAMDRLSKSDREAVLLRFYRGMSTAEVGHALGVSDEAAKKRVQRAVDKLRERLAAKGVMGTSAGLSAMLVGNVSTDAPGHLAHAVLMSAGGMAKGTMAGVITRGAMNMMLLARMKLGVAVVLGAVLVAGTAVVGRRIATGSGVAAQEVSALPVYSVLGSEWTHVRMDNARTPERLREIVGDAPLRETIHFNAVTGVVACESDFNGFRQVIFMSPEQRQRLKYDSRINRITVSKLGETAKELRDRLEIRWSADWAKLRADGVLKEEPRVEVSRTREGELDRYRVVFTMRDPEMQLDPATLWVDPKTGRLRKAVAGFHGETTTSSFSEGEPRIRDIYDLGVPRDAEVVRETDAPNVAAAANQRLKFVPKAGTPGASWSHLTPMQNIPGVSMAQAHSPIGGHFPIQDKDDKTLFELKVLEGDDEHLLVEVSAENYLEQFDLSRDKAVAVEVVGKQYEILFPTVTVSTTAPSTTSQAMIIVTSKP